MKQVSKKLRVSIQKAELHYQSSKENYTIEGAESHLTYYREKEQYFGLLQAQPGAASNLLTMTNDDQVYSYILKFFKELPKLNYFISSDEIIGNKRPKSINAK